VPATCLSTSSAGQLHPPSVLRGDLRRERYFDDRRRRMGSTGGQFRALALRQCAIFPCNFKLICPVQSRSQKYSASRQTQITPTTPAVPSRERGVGHRHERWGGLRWTRQRQVREEVRRAVIRERSTARRRTALKRLRQIFGWPALGWLKFLAEEAAYGKTVWSWRPWLVSSRRRFAKPDRAMRAVNSPATEARGIRLRGELGISRKTIAQGMPGCSGCTCMLVCAFLSASCTRDRGC
jgi:hypothetical protein